MYKNVKMLRQLRYILPAFLTDPNSSCKTTSIYLWFLVSLRYSLKLCFLMPIASTWLATSVAEKVGNQSNLLPNQPIYPSIYTSLWSSSTICLPSFQQHGLSKTLLPPLQLSPRTTTICYSTTLLLASELLAPPPLQIIIVAPPQTIIVRRLPYTRWSSLVLQKQPPCISTVNESNVQPNQWWLQKNQDQKQYSSIVRWPAVRSQDVHVVFAQKSW